MGDELGFLICEMGASVLTDGSPFLLSHSVAMDFIFWLDMCALHYKIPAVLTCWEIQNLHSQSMPQQT